MCPSARKVMRLQILLLILGVGSLFPQSQKGIELDVLVTKVERIKRDSVRVDMKIVNRAHAMVLLPKMGGEPPKIHSLEIERFEPKRAWVLLPLNGELPAFDAIEIKAGGTYEDVLYLHDPISIKYPRQEIPLYGKYRIRVGYFSSETDWKAYLAQSAALAQLPPEKYSHKGLLAPKYAYSKAFEIRKVSSQR